MLFPFSHPAIVLPIRALFEFEYLSDIGPAATNALFLSMIPANSYSKLRFLHVKPT